jgi:hypothetical protein
MPGTGRADSGADVAALRARVGDRQIAYIQSLVDRFVAAGDAGNRDHAYRLLGIALGDDGYLPDGESLAGAAARLIGTCWADGFGEDPSDLNSVTAHLLAAVLADCDHVHWKAAERILDTPEARHRRLLGRWSTTARGSIRECMRRIAAQRAWRLAHEADLERPRGDARDESLAGLGRSPRGNRHDTEGS